MNSKNINAWEQSPFPKQKASCKLYFNYNISSEIFIHSYVWPGPAPKSGQFFMVKPKKSPLFLGRPISVALWEPKMDSGYIRDRTQDIQDKNKKRFMEKYLRTNTVRFIIAKRGKGTHELAGMRNGDEAELIGPLGNSWLDFLPEPKKSIKTIALVGGGVGVAPLLALLGKRPVHHFFWFYAGFKTDINKHDMDILLEKAYSKAKKVIISTENSKSGFRGMITDFLDIENHLAVLACGPEPMLKTVAEKCKASGVPCFISMERRMACGMGACLGCTVKTINGNRRCCADGPIFNAEEVIFDE